MARLTVKQLAAQLEAAHVAYQRLEAEHEALKARLNVRESQRQLVQTTPYREALARARSLAMSTGKCVKVGGGA